MGSAQEKMVDNEKALFRPLMHSPVAYTFAPTSPPRMKTRVPSVPVPSSARSYNTRCRNTCKRRSYKRKKQKRKSCPTSRQKSKRRKRSKSRPTRTASRKPPRRQNSTRRRKRRSSRRTNYLYYPCKRRKSSGCDGGCPSLKLIMNRLCEIERLLPPKKRYAKCRSRMKGIMRQLDALQPCYRAGSRDLTPRQKSLEDLIASLCHKRREGRERSHHQDRSRSSYYSSRESSRHSSPHQCSRHQSSGHRSSRGRYHRCAEPRRHREESCHARRRSSSRKREGSSRGRKSCTPLRLHFQGQCGPAVVHRPPSQSHSCQTQAGSDEQHHSVITQASNDSELYPQPPPASETKG